MRNVGGRETFIATPRRSRLVGAGPSMPKRSFSSHPGASASPSPHLSFAYRERWATTQHGARSTEPEQGSMQHAACSIPFLPMHLLESPYFLGLREGRRQHFFTHGWPLDPVCNSCAASEATVGSQPQIHSGQNRRHDL